MKPLNLNQQATEVSSQRVWDPLVRVLHWTLVAGVVAAWLTSEAGRSWHEPAGYVVLAVLLLRLIWGFMGSPYARFVQFVRAPRTVWAYGCAVLRNRAPRYLGHNPLGGWMILALITALFATGISGYLMTTTTFFGEEWVEEFHELAAESVLVLAGLHIAGVVLSSWQHRENLVRAMFTGRKAAPQAGDIAE